MLTPKAPVQLGMTLLVSLLPLTALEAGPLHLHSSPPTAKVPRRASILTAKEVKQKSGDY